MAADLTDAPLWNEKDSLELKLTFNGEVLDGEMVLPVIGQALVEGGVLFGGNVGRIACPDRLGLVQFLVGGLLFFDLLRFLLLGLVLLIIDFLNLGLVISLLHLLILILDLLK